MRLVSILAPLIWELKKTTSLYKNQLTATNFIYAVVPIVRRELRSSFATVSACLVAVALMAFALIRLIQQGEAFFRQYANGDALVFGFYCAILLCSGLGLYLLLTAEPPLREVERSVEKQVLPLSRRHFDAVLTGLREGFEEGLRKRHEIGPPPVGEIARLRRVY